MGPTLINGLPAHVLLVHVVVILVPITALALVASAVRPAWIRRLGVVLPLLALVTLVSVPLTTHAGEWLEQHEAGDPLVQRHADLGDTLLPWAAAMFLVTVAVWWVGRRAAAKAAAEPSQAPRRDGAVPLALPVRLAAVVLSVVVAAGSVVTTYRIGESGARAAWHDGYSATPVKGHSD